MRSYSTSFISVLLKSGLASSYSDNVQRIGQVVIVGGRMRQALQGAEHGWRGNDKQRIVHALL
jgi:hypothetical protein